LFARGGRTAGPGRWGVAGELERAEPGDQDPQRIAAYLDVVGAHGVDDDVVEVADRSPQLAQQPHGSRPRTTGG
jgi:hypothetical protein